MYITFIIILAWSGYLLGMDWQERGFDYLEKKEKNESKKVRATDWQKKSQTNKKNLAYLQTKPFHNRQKIAAEWIQENNECTLVIDVGGGESPIHAYLAEEIKSIVIDPCVNHLATKETPNRIYVSNSFENWHGEDEVIDKKYAVVILGLALKMPDHGWHKLNCLIGGSKKAIIEYSATFHDAKKQLRCIKKYVKEHTNKKITREVSFDFSEQKVEGPSRRTMICFE